MDSLDYDRLWKQFWIDNFEEEIKKFKNLKKEKQENINKKYPLTEEDFLLFLNMHYNYKINYTPKSFLPSEYIIKVPEFDFISFWQRNEIVNDNAKDKLILYFKLIQRWYIFWWLKDYIIHSDINDKTTKLKELLEKYRVKDKDEKSNVFIVQKWYWASVYGWNLFKNIFNKITWKEKTYKVDRKWENYYLGDLLDDNIWDLIENLDYWIDFNIKFFDKNIFVLKILIEFEKYELKINKSTQIENLFLDIKEQIWNKNNHSWEILLSYPVKNYIKEKNLYYDILYQLHIKENIRIESIYIFQNSINFVVNKINNFNESIIHQLTPIYDRISFEWWKLKLDTKVLLEWKKTWDKVYEIINIIVTWIKRYKNLELTFEELKIIFLEDENKYKYFLDNINKNWVYFEVKNRYLKEQNEKMKELYKNEFNDLLNKIFIQDFFHSTLSKWKEQNYFRTKSNSVILAI